jgi:hypothetical protein
MWSYTLKTKGGHTVVISKAATGIVCECNCSPGARGVCEHVIRLLGCDGSDYVSKSSDIDLMDLEKKLPDSLIDLITETDSELNCLLESKKELEKLMKRVTARKLLLAGGL